MAIHDNAYNKGQQLNTENLQEKRELLRGEIAHFETEKEKLKKDIGELGGTKFSSKELITNVIFGVLLVLLFVAQFVFKWLPEIISLEIGLFLVSLKIILMIYSQHKHNHFMFWILNTIEFRLNLIHKSIKKIEKEVEKKK